MFHVGLLACGVGLGEMSLLLQICALEWGQHVSIELERLVAWVLLGDRTFPEEF
jgi:hypothetical protein